MNFCVPPDLVFSLPPAEASVRDLQTWSGDNHELFDSESAAKQFLGYLDAIFMFSYAFGLYASGWIGDRIEARYVLTFGMLGSGVTVQLALHLLPNSCPHSCSLGDHSDRRKPTEEGAESTGGKESKGTLRA